MRVVLYARDADRRKSCGIANSVDDVLHAPANLANAPNIAIKMNFVRIHAARPRFSLNAATNLAITNGIGANAVNELVIIMHAGPGKLSTEDCTNPAGTWAQYDVAWLINTIQPASVFFLCCSFGKIRTEAIIPGIQSADGLQYIADRIITPGVNLYAATEAVMVVSGMPVLRPVFFQRHVVS